MSTSSKTPALESTAEKKLRNYQLLARVSRVITSSLDSTRVLELVLGEAVRIMQATSGSIALINPHTQLLEVEVARGLGQDATELKLAIGRGVTGWVAKTGQPLRVPDVTTDERYVSVRESIRSELAVPLLVEDALIGVLNVDSTRRDAFSADDEELLLALAGQAAQVIHNSWLYEAVAFNARKLEALFQVGQSIISSHHLPEILDRVVREACELLQVKVCSLMLLDPTGTELVLSASHGAGPGYRDKPPLPVADSMLGVVVTRQRPLQVEDVQQHGGYRHVALAREEGLVSLLCVPMVFDNRTIGVLNVYTGTPYRFSTQDIKILSALANLAAVAIENARLHEKVVAAEEQLRHSERLNTLGLLAAEVAHEIRNPLTSMQMLFHSLDLEFEADDPRTGDVTVIAERMHHLNRIVDQLLGYARSTEPQFAPVPLNEVIEDILLLARPRLRQQSVELVTGLADRLPSLNADRHQLEQACLNLILNAIEAMPEGGTLTIRSAVTAPGRVELAFTDTGTGIAAEVKERLFRPFLTTKTAGTGLGLAIVQKIVEAHDGTIEIDSQPGRGTTARLVFRVA